MSLVQNYWNLYIWNNNWNKGLKNIEILNSENSHFNPYQNNGGTIVAFSGKSYTIIASDTRCSSGFSIPTRFQTRIMKISKKILLATSGMFADINFIQRHIKNNINEYQYCNKESIFIDNCAFYVSSTLYSKRFFPYYTFNILSGIDKNQKGSVYNFDAVGSFEKVKFNCVGSGQLLIQPLLDSHFGGNCDDFVFDTNSINNVLCCIKEFFLKVSKRGIQLGDGLQFFISSKKGVLIENYFLKID
jgi:20S proteasome subunit beta 6